MYTGIELILKDKEILPFETMWMTLEYIILSKINQTERQLLQDLMCELSQKSNAKTQSRAMGPRGRAMALQGISYFGIGHSPVVHGGASILCHGILFLGIWQFNMKLITKSLPVRMKMRECIRFCKEHKAPTLSLLPSCWLCASYSPVLITNVTATKRFF